MKSIGIKERYMRNDAQVKLPDKEPTLRVVPMPADVNQYGDIFGGWIMSQVDIAGANPAAQRARGRTATVAVNSFIFKQLRTFLVKPINYFISNSDCFGIIVYEITEFYWRARRLHTFTCRSCT